MSFRSRKGHLGLVLATFTAGLMVLAAAGCYPGGPQDSSDSLISLTFNSSEADYSGILTYAMPDTVLPLRDPEDVNYSSLNRRYDRTILDGIAGQLDERGFQRIENPDESNVPDVIVLIGSVETQGYLIYSTWGYPGYGWGYPYWGYGYYGYYGYPYSNITQYATGSVVWLMIDLRDVDVSDPGEEDAAVLWVAGINGAVTSSSPDPTPGIQQGIAQCFIQSPYIQADSSGN